MNVLRILLILLVAPLAVSAQTASAGEPVVLKISDFKWFGDFRYRYDHYDYETQAPETNDLQKLRFRIGFGAKVMEEAKIDFRLATGPGRTSTNQTLGGGANHDILIDRASFELPFLGENKFVAGRMRSPFVLAGGSDLVWDADFNFDGVSVQRKLDFLNGSTSISRFVIDDESAALSAVYLNTAHIAASFKTAEAQTLLISAAYYHYEGIKGHTGMAETTTTSGNSSNVCGTDRCYVSNFKIADMGLEYSFSLANLPLSIYGNYILNTAAANDNTGVLAGFKLNGLAKKGDWALTYDYRVLEKEGAFGAFTDGESFGGGANGKGHRLNLSYQFGQSWYLSTTGFLGKKNIAAGETEVDRNRLLLDLVLQF